MAAPDTSDSAVAVRDDAPVVVSEAEGAFALAQRQAQALAQSELVPQDYQGNVPNCMIALELAQRTGSSPFMVMQNVFVIHGRPSWSSQFIIASLNACGRFSPLRFDVSGEDQERQCVAWAIDKSTGDRLDGPPVSMAMAKAEGWSTKKGSKWVTLPELMLRYRSAAFFGRLYAPDILMGMQTQEEVYDITPTAGYERAEVPAADAIAQLRGEQEPAEPEVIAPTSDHPAPALIECELCEGSGRDPEIPGDICGACNGQGQTLV